MGLLRDASFVSLCSHDGEYRCEVCMATNSDSNTEDERYYSVTAPTQSFETEPRRKTSVMTEIVQAELALWTFALSALFAYVWRHRRSSALFSVLVVLPTVMSMTALLSSLLAVMVLAGRLFCSSPIDYSDWIVCKRPPSPWGSRKTSGASVCSRPSSLLLSSPLETDDQNANYIWHRQTSFSDRAKMSRGSSRRSTVSNPGI